MSVRSYRSSVQQPRYVHPFTFTTVADAWGAGGAGGAGFEELVEFDEMSESDGVAVEAKLSTSYRLSTLVPPHTDCWFPLQTLLQKWSGVGMLARATVFPQ